VMTEPKVRRGLVLLALGIGLFVFFHGLRAAGVGGFEASSPNIGGGLIPLAGAVSVVVGLGFLIQG